MAHTYHVHWEIDLVADSPREAAERALAIQRDPESIATVFDVSQVGSYLNADPISIDLTWQEDV